jgi:hypothetical protein
MAASSSAQAEALSPAHSGNTTDNSGVAVTIGAPAPPPDAAAALAFPPAALAAATCELVKCRCQ